MKLKIVFFGNTTFSAIGAAILHEKIGLHTIVTIPDRFGKKNELLPSPTKQFAVNNTIPVIETAKLTPEIIELIKAIQPDFLVVEDYGLILPKGLLAIPKYAPINIHHSLLPKYRGPAPAPSAILHGEKTSGVTVIHMTAEVDAGDIYAQQTYDLNSTETTESLLTVLNTMGGNLAVEVIKQIVNRKAQPKPQDDTQATFTKFMQKSDGYIDAASPPSPQQINRMIRAYYPWPGVWTRLPLANGELRLIKFLPKQRIQMEGKKAMVLKDFYNGYPELQTLVESLLQRGN